MFIYVISFVLGIASSVAAAVLLAFIANRSVLRFSFRRVLRDILKLRRLLEADNYRPDLLVGIDRNGSIVGSILAGHLGPTSILSAHTQTTRKPDGYREVVLSEPHNPPDGSLAGKTILLVGCFVDTGKTAEAVYEYYKSRSDGPDVRVAALYTSPAPILKPRYHVYVIGRDINVPMTRVMHKMPWMSEEWKFSFAGER
jgi:hypoxanthine phosphoribosyltransferase